MGNCASSEPSGQTIWQEQVLAQREAYRSEPHSVNLDSVEEWEPVLSDANITEVNAVQIPKRLQYSNECMEAKNRELKLLEEYSVYSVLPDEGQYRISTTWVVSEKTVEGKLTVKARLVCRGFEEEEEVIKDSPTCSKDAIRSFLFMAASYDWPIESTDVKSAFLQGEELDREVLVEPPPEANHQGKLWLLQKPLYGLNDAPRRWFLCVCKALIEKGCVQSKLDPSLFIYPESNGQTGGCLVVHVDDFLHAGNEDFREQIVEPIRLHFTAGKIESNNFLYIGLELYQSINSITLSQSDYVQKLNSVVVPIERKAVKTSPLTKVETRQFRAIVGQINWAAQQTRPDLLFEVLELSMKFKCPVIDDLLRANKALKKMQSSDVAIIFPKLSYKQELKLFAMSDSSFANLTDGVSSGAGHVIFIVGNNSKCALLAWKSNKIRRVVRSTMAAEALALEECLEHAIYLRSLIKEMSGGAINPSIEAWTDNRDTYAAV